MENSRFEFRVWEFPTSYHNGKMVSQKGFVNNTLQYLVNEESFSKSRVVMQYTGLKDKNGVKVFEGDIVEAMQEYELGEDKWYGVGEVEFYNGSFVFRYKIDDSWGLLTGLDEIEVIGNIYEHSYLLGENK